MTHPSHVCAQAYGGALFKACRATGDDVFKSLPAPKPTPPPVVPGRPAPVHRPAPAAAPVTMDNCKQTQFCKVLFRISSVRINFAGLFRLRWGWRRLILSRVGFCPRKTCGSGQICVDCGKRLSALKVLREEGQMVHVKRVAN